MTRPAMRVTTRVLPTGEVIVVVEPIIEVIDRQTRAIDVGRNTVLATQTGASAASPFVAGMPQTP